MRSTLLLDALDSKEVVRPPIWLMRQAGRYLPEYRSFRLKHSLSSLFHSPELAKEVTLMPLDRFPLDAAILFSDLLVLVEVWGKKACYPESGGVHIEGTILGVGDLFEVTKEEVAQKMSYVFETIQLLKPSLNIPLLGFSGAPFTLLCYLLDGKNGGFESIRFWMDHRKEEFKTLLDIVCNACIHYLQLQIASGVDAIQIFDSWTHLLSKEEFSLYALPYWKKIQDALQGLGAPSIFFSRTTSLYPELISTIRPGAISFDENASLNSLRKRVPEGIAVQGNFCPNLLAIGTKEEVREAALRLKESVQGEKGIVFNLGHGVLPKTPIENVEILIESLR